MLALCTLFLQLVKEKTGALHRDHRRYGLPSKKSSKRSSPASNGTEATSSAMDLEQELRDKVATVLAILEITKLKIGPHLAKKAVRPYNTKKKVRPCPGAGKRRHSSSSSSLIVLVFFVFLAVGLAARPSGDQDRRHRDRRRHNGLQRHHGRHHTLQGRPDDQGGHLTG